MKLLAAIDHSDASDAVIREIAARPWPANSHVEVLNVAEPAHMWTLSQTAEEIKRLSVDMVRRVAEEFRGAGLDAAGLSLAGDPKRVILDRAKETNADFILIGATGVASAVVGHAPCSVEIVRAHGNKTSGAPGVRNILLATDGSEFSERAARSIAERPWSAGTEITVLSVVELHVGTAQALFEPPFVDNAQMELQREESMRRAQNAVSRSVEILSRTFSKVSESISVLLDGPKAVILAEAEKIGADLIVVGSHGHHGIERFLLGSVSEGVALHARCSVEVIR
jgi:nucleotide-binding universal stress UspA family protein